MSGYREYLLQNRIEPDLRYDHAPQVDGVIGTVVGSNDALAPALREISGSSGRHDWQVRFDSHVKLGILAAPELGFPADAFCAEELEVVGHVDTVPSDAGANAMVTWDTLNGHLCALRVTLPAVGRLQVVERGSDQWNALEAYLRQTGDIT